ncbi:NAD(P)H-dependent oxidoreductase, partial [Thermodesulfobacteriota bacterium]
LYMVLFIMSEISLIPDRTGFTAYFAKKKTHESEWTTDHFKKINRHVTLIWAGIFILSIVSGLIPGLFGLSGAFTGILFEAVIPVMIMLCLGLPLNKRYPEYYQKKMGAQPEKDIQDDDQNVEHDSAVNNYSYGDGSTYYKKNKEHGDMDKNPKIVAINGSPHAGIGNTSIMLDMLRPGLELEGFELDVVVLKDCDITYCAGCGTCLEKGRCWINDDHRGIVSRLLNADGVILGSPVYFMHVTAQMKAFIDRCLPYGHKPRDTWKPGLAISVSAGSGEMEVGQYLSLVMRAFGAFPVGALTAIAAQPGGFMGMEAVEARAVALARDLAGAIKEKQRYPVNEYDMRFYQFMGNLVKENKDTFMKHDYDYWQEHGFYEGFESYIKQKPEKAYYNKEVRDAWVREMASEERQKRDDLKKETPGGAEHQALENAGSLKEILMVMPNGFNASEAEDMSVVYQFEVSGSEDFVAHLKIEKGECKYIDGPSDNPDVVISTPAEVWMAISRGEKDGQQEFMRNQYMAKGDISLLMRFRSLFSS